jgi:gliding motility-associated-like protein
MRSIIFIWIVLSALKTFGQQTELKPTKYVCKNIGVQLIAESGWDHTHWISKLKGALSDDFSFFYNTTQDDTVTLELSNDTGESLTYKIPIIVSLPPVDVTADNYEILRGKSVHLNASGGVSYKWTPAESLDNDAIADPEARPQHTTQYSVTATDTIGCTESKTILIDVVDTAFLPDLFTPNDDGKNDELKVYGFNMATTFTFSIFNREGGEVYNTSSVSELLNIGWDGSANGVKQPNGTYFWKITGKDNQGKDLYLNGKTMGSVVLMR